jgi:aminoglycoside phosphotransferase (APT) family kinase protein
MAPLWSALAEHAVPLVEAAGGRSLASRHAHLADTVDRWSAALEASELTVIHHDFNPRNAALRPSAAGDVLSAYDWELATVGLPQRDLVEFLCFALPANVDATRFWAIVERYRCLLARASACQWPQSDWHNGLRAALALLLVDRLAFYALIHRVRPQAFLTRVLRTWQRLDALASSPLL